MKEYERSCFGCSSYNLRPSIRLGFADNICYAQHQVPRITAKRRWSICRIGKMEAADANSITILRKRSQYEPLRNIISGLWFAVLYRAVERHTGCDKATRKDSRCRAIRNLTTFLRAGNKISSHNNNISKTVSKRMRSGLASWSTISQKPGLLALRRKTCTTSNSF